MTLDRAAEFESEFLDGEIVAMSGRSSRHSCVTVNLTIELGMALRGTSCRAYDSNLRVRVSPRVYTYPDLVVVRGKLKLADERQDIVLNPAVIFEVLSPSTEQYDRGVKFQHYRGVDSLQDYILIAQDQRRVERFTRGADNIWALHDYQGAGDRLLIDSIGVSVPLSAIYEGVEFPAE